MGRGWLCQGGVIAGARGVWATRNRGRSGGSGPASSSSDPVAAVLFGRDEESGPGVAI